MPPARGLLWCCAMLAFAGIAAGAMPAGPRRGTIVISNVTVIDVVGGAKLVDQMVMVVDGKIADVSKDFKLPAVAEVIDGRGKFLIPGLWDMHVHLLWEPAIDTLFPLCVAN